MSLDPVPVLDHLAAAFRDQWRRYRKGLKCCRKGYSAAAVHETRVAARRLLSLVELADRGLSARDAEAAQAALKRQMKVFKELRDTQVQLQAVARMRRTQPAAEGFYGYLIEREQRLIRRTRKAVRRIDLRSLRRRIAACRDRLEEQRRKGNLRAASPLIRAVNRAFARTQELRARIDPADTETIHRTRIAFKKFRYMVEALAPCMPGLTPAIPGAMRAYQALMGNIQDTEVVLAGLDKFARKRKVESQTVQRLRAAIARRRQRQIRTYLTAVDTLDELWLNI
jgi:CHAD domain-containing protein